MSEQQKQLAEETDSFSVMLVDDYGHHPREVAAVIKAVRGGWPERRLVMVYQPHRYSRTAQFLEEFAAALEDQARGPVGVGQHQHAVALLQPQRPRQVLEPGLAADQVRQPGHARLGEDQHRPHQRPVQQRGLDRVAAPHEVEVVGGTGQQLGAQRHAVDPQAAAHGEAGLQDVVRALEAKGVKPAYVARFDLGFKDLTNELKEAKAAGANAVLTKFSSPELTDCLVKAARTVVFAER